MISFSESSADGLIGKQAYGILLYINRRTKMVAEYTTEEWSAALDETAGEILQAAGVEHLPVDAIALAAALEVEVAWDSRQSGRAHLVRVSRPGEGQATTSQTSILLRPEPRPERQHWAVAHELGEAFAEGFFARLNIRPEAAPVNLRERVANQLAARILLPSERFLQLALDCRWDLLTLKQRFSTASHELIAARMLDFPSQAIISLFDNGKITWRRSNVAGRTPPLNAEEQRARRAAAAGQIYGSFDRSVQAWPIHEPHWKREIIRRAVSEWNDVDDDADC